MDPQIDDVNSQIAALRSDSRELFMIEFSEAAPEFELTEPSKTVVPHCWRWEDYYPMLLRSAEIVDPHQAFRRSFMLCNPGLYPKPFTTQTLDSACSLYNPGETAPVHRHTPSASRFGLEGTGGFSTVEGEKCSFGRGDLVLTPPGDLARFRQRRRPADRVLRCGQRPFVHGPGGQLLRSGLHRG